MIIIINSICIYNIIYTYICLERERERSSTQALIRVPRCACAARAASAFQRRSSPPACIIYNMI